jgi:hypothetical protein
MPNAVPALKPKHYFLVALGALAAWIAILLTASRPYDFMGYYAAGSLLLRHPHDLYSLTAQLAGERAVGIGKYALLTWAHPAPEALLFAPLALLSFHNAFAVWSAISLGMFVLSGCLLREEILGLPEGCRYALVAFSFYPVASGLLVGQDHGLFLLLWVLAYRSWKAGDEFASGLWIGLSLIRYQFAVPMLLFFIVLRAWKLLRGVAISGCALLAVSFLLVGNNLVLSYLKALHFLAQANDGVALLCMPTIRGLAGWVLPSHDIIAAAVAVTGLLAWALLKVRGMSRLDAFCFAMAISLLADPHAYLYEAVVLTIPLIMFLRRRPSSAILAFIVCALSFASSFAQMENSASRFMQTEDFAVLCPVLLVWAIWMGRVYGAQSPGQEAVVAIH